MNHLLRVFILTLALLVAGSAHAELYFDGFMQGLYGGRLDQSNPTSSEQTASESRLQLRAQHYGDKGNFFGRLDFTWDGLDSTQYDWELREAYLRFRLGADFDFKVGRQILTWGTGDLIFINDVFAKDYQSFFIGRDDQYLKAPQNAVRIEYYNPIGALAVVWSPKFEPNRNPTGMRLSYFNPMAGSGGMIAGSANSTYMAPMEPESKFENSEVATRLQHRFGNFMTAVYAYRGFYKNPVGFDPNLGAPVYPGLNLFGASIRGTLSGGILWLEGGYYDSRSDRDGDNPFIPNSSISGLIGYEKQIANNLTVNLQWQADYLTDYETYKMQQTGAGAYVRDEVRHLLTTRWTKLLHSELITLSAFAFYSPSDNDAYVRFSTEYKYTDEIRLAFGGNIFAGNNDATDFGQFDKNDNIWTKLTYGF